MSVGRWIKTLGLALSVTSVAAAFPGGDGAAWAAHRSTPRAVNAKRAPASEEALTLFGLRVIRAAAIQTPGPVMMFRRAFRSCRSMASVRSSLCTACLLRGRICGCGFPRQSKVRSALIGYR